MGHISVIVLPVKMRTSLVILLCMALLFSLLSPEVEGAVVRGRGRKRGGRVGGYKRKSRGQGGRRTPVQRRRGRTGAATPPDADAVTDDSVAKDDGAVGAAGALGDLAGICEILMFDRGEGTYSLKFIKNC